MATRRSRTLGGALIPITLRAPGINGLNFEGDQVSQDFSYARIAENVVYDKAGRLAARKGFTKLSSSALTGSPTMSTLFMYDYSSGNMLINSAVVSGSNKIYESASPYSAFTDRTGALTPTGVDWQWQNFNDKVVGAQAGNTMIVKSGSGNFAAISATSGTVPTGDCVHSAFGRLWAQKANTGVSQGVVAYSALLDETHWSTGAGEINILGTANAVKSGYDEIVAISSIDQYLVVFLRESIVIYGSPDDPSTLSIAKIIQGVGCIARDSVQQVGTELFFLSATGVRGLKQVMESETNLELSDISALVRRELVDSTRANTSYKVRSVFSPEESLYLLFGSDGIIWAFDTHIIGEAAQGVRITNFVDTNWTSAYNHEGVLYLGKQGTIGKYYGYLDDSATYNVRWMSNWSDVGDPRLKILKKINSVVEGASNQIFTFDWEMDYGLASGSGNVSIPSGGTIAEYGISEYGIAEYSGGLALYNIASNASRTGQVLSFGFHTTVNNQAIAVEQFTISLKTGREAR